MRILLFVGVLLFANITNASFTPKEGIVEDEKGWYIWKEFTIGQNISYWAIQLVQLKTAYAQEINVWLGYSKLKKICACESAGGSDREPRQFDEKGNPLWGYDPKTGKPIKNDVGMCQISLPYHLKETKRLGLDVINSFEDNVAFAKILWKREGDKPWRASEKCWKK